MKLIFCNCRVWYFGSLYCSINQFFSLSTVPASVFTMLAITLDRRRAVMTPLSPRTTKVVVMVSLITIWSLCTIIALPATIHSQTIIINPNARYKPCQTRLWFQPKPSCYGLRNNKTTRNMVIPNPSWVLVETNSYKYEKLSFTPIP